MSEWKNCQLSSIANVQTGPFGSQLKNEQYITGGTPVITVEHIHNFKIKNISYPSVTDEDRNRLSKYSLKNGDIIFTRVGSVDLSAYVSEKNEGWLFSSRMLRVRVTSKEVDSRFLSYFFMQNKFREHILNISVGATMPSINTSILNSIDLSYPVLLEQKAIASVLSSLDDKIDLLHRQNKTLESMAETLFRQWFVEEAQEDWEEVKLSELGKIICGKTPSKNNSMNYGNDIPFLKIPDMHGKVYIINTMDNLSSAGANTQKNKLVRAGSICVSCIATVGLVCLTEQGIHTNQQINSITPVNTIHKYFLFLYMKSMYEELHSMASGGTATLNLNTSNFSNIKIPLPTKNTLDKFNEIVIPIFDKIYSNSLQIKNLENLRDTLLPKLMSGEVRVKYEESHD